MGRSFIDSFVDRRLMAETLDGAAQRVITRTCPPASKVPSGDVVTVRENMRRVISNVSNLLRTS